MIRIILTIVFVILCIAMTGIVLMQEGKSAGLGAIGGIAESYWGKNRGRSMEGKLEKFTKIAAFGIFTDVSYETDQAVKNVLGHMAYILEGAKRIFNIPSYKIKVEHDGEVIEDEFIFGMVTNSRSVGGFSNMVGKNIVFDDGLFEVTLIKTPKNPIALQEIIAALLIEQVDTKHMYTFKTKKITFDSVEEIPWTLDGEFGGEQDYVEIENVQKAMEIMVPENHVLELSEQKNKIERD